MDVTENDPSLIDCLESGKHGLLLDLIFPSGEPDGVHGVVSGTSPFSKTISAQILTNGDVVIQDVLLVMQRDRYDPPRSLVPVNNIEVEAAWQNALAFHRNSDQAKAAAFFKHQVNPSGEFKPFQPLFRCQATRQWFHPVCPQCGLELRLCRDDALLEKRGLPTYADSLERFLYCGSCTTLSGLAPFYCREKATGMPDIVQDASALVVQWKQLLANLPDETDLPCRGCPDMGACFGPESLGSQRIMPFSFFPFHMMMFPAPSCDAADFLRMISNDITLEPRILNIAAFPSGPNRFLFQDQDRQFLEILYLKLTFLAQTFRQLMPVDGAPNVQAVDLSLEGIGVDLNPVGVGLPAYWSFNVRILDAVGTFLDSPFAPIMPQAPRLHFLGAVWFRTLLVNSRQNVKTVYAEVGRLIDQMGTGKEPETPQIDPSDPAGVFAGSQIFWTPDRRNLPEKWQVFWKQALHVGFQLVHAGLKTGVLWEYGQFQASLDELRQQIKDEMFSSPLMMSTGTAVSAPSDKLKMVLGGILEKWQTAAGRAGSQPTIEKEPNNADVEETVVLSAESATPFPGAAPPIDDLDRTVVIAPPSNPPGHPSPLKEMDIAATMVQKAAGPSAQPPLPGPSPLSAGGFDEDLEATMILNASGSPAPSKQAPSTDDDLAATMIQGAAGRQPVPTPSSGISPSTVSQPTQNWGDPDATIVINPADRPAGVNPNSKTSPGSADDDLAATMIETPRGNTLYGNQTPPTENLPPRPPTPPQPPSRAVTKPQGGDDSMHGSADHESNDDEIMEQTIIIRSDVKKD